MLFANDRKQLVPANVTQKERERERRAKKANLAVSGHTISFACVEATLKGSKKRLK